MEAVATFLRIFGARMNILFHYQSEDLCAHQMVIQVTRMMLTIEPRIINIVGTSAPTFLNTCIFGICFWSHTTQIQISD